MQIKRVRVCCQMLGCESQYTYWSHSIWNHRSQCPPVSPRCVFLLFTSTLHTAPTPQCIVFSPDKYTGMLVESTSLIYIYVHSLIIGNQLLITNTPVALPISPCLKKHRPGPSSSPGYMLLCPAFGAARIMILRLFDFGHRGFVVKPENPYFASRPGFEVNPLGVYPPDCVVKNIVTLFFFVFCCYAATQLALQLHQECTQVACSNTEERKDLT